MAHGENLSTSSDNPESSDDKHDSKKKRAVRVPLGLTAEQPTETPPAEAPKVPARLFDILEQQQAERAQAQQAELEASEQPEKKKKKRKKKSAETAQPVAVEGEESDSTERFQEDTTELADDTHAEAEGAEHADDLESEPVVETTEPGSAEAEPKEPLVAEGAVEIPLTDHAEEEVALSERVMAWNRAQQQSPPRAPMSEVGQPLVEVPTEAEASEVPALPQESALQTAITPAHVQEVMPEPSQWRQQLEQQAQAEIDAAAPRSVPPRTPITPAVPIGPSMPAVPPEVIASRMPTPSQQPEVIEREVVRESPSDFWPGVVVGAGVEHIRHKRREKRMEQVQDAQQEQIQQLENEQARTKLEQDLAERQQLRDAADAARQEQRSVSPLESPLVAQLPLNSEQSPLAPVAPAAETAKQPERAVPGPEQSEETQPEAPDRHIETSSWHAIEIDNRTGHAVEQPNIEYGQAFHQEQQAERLPQQQNDAVTSANMAGVPTLPPPAAAQPTDPRMMGTQTDTQTSHSVAPQPAQQQSTSKPIIQSAADAALWGGLVIVVMAIVIALSL